MVARGFNQVPFSKRLGLKAQQPLNPLITRKAPSCSTFKELAVTVMEGVKDQSHQGLQKMNLALNKAKDDNTILLARRLQMLEKRTPIIAGKSANTAVSSKNKCTLCYKFAGASNNAVSTVSDINAALLEVISNVP